jgi:hypothetical protein
MLRRADRALLLAKDTGRNKVVQLGTGIGDPQPERRKSRWWPWHAAAAPLEVKHKWTTFVPLRVAMEKLRGFIADNNAEIINIVGNSVTLELSDANQDRRRRSQDRPVPMVVNITFSEESVNLFRPSGEAIAQRTRIEVGIRPKRPRDRRKDGALDPGRRVSTSLRAYLMAMEYTMAQQ